MPAPIHPDYNFKVNHKKRDNHYSMNTAASYENMYGIGYMISGDRIIITPQKTVTVHPGTIQFIHKNLIHRTTYISEGIYENIWSPTWLIFLTIPVYYSLVNYFRQRKQHKNNNCTDNQED